MSDLIVQSSPDINVTVTGPNAVAVSVVTGQAGVDGREVELRVSAGLIQWRYVGETTWTDLIALNLLKGDTGEAGDDGREIELLVRDGFIQWSYVGDPSLTNLVALSALTGPPGAAGPNTVSTATTTAINGLLAGNGTNVYGPTATQARALIKIQRRLEFTFDGNGSALSDSDSTPINAVDFAGAIVSWILLETDGTGVAVDVWRVGSGSIPTALDSIVDGDYPTGNGQASGNVADWSETALAVGDVVVASLQNAGGATYIKLALICEEG